MQTWDFDKDEQQGNKVEYTKFPIGITTIRLVDDIPFVRWTHWLQTQQRTVTCPGSNSCPICKIMKAQKESGEKATYSSSKKLALQIINRNTGKLEMLEQGSTFFNDLKDMLEEAQNEGKSILDFDIKVKRKGTGQSDTSYRLDLDECYEYTEADVELMEKKVVLTDYFVSHEAEKITRVLNGEKFDEVMYGVKNEGTSEEPAYTIE